VYVDPSGNIFLIDDILIGALIGAAIGAGTSAATGGDIAMGALTGAIGGAFFGAAGGIIQGLQNGAITGVCQIVSPGMQAGIHAAAGAMSGGINAAITGGNVGMGALTGGISGGIGKYFGSFLPDDLPSQLTGRSLIGGLTGGLSTALYGGNFGQGFGQGAWTAGIGLFCNDILHAWYERAADFIKQLHEGSYVNLQAAYGVGAKGLLVNSEGVFDVSCKGGGYGLSATYSNAGFQPGGAFYAVQYVLPNGVAIEVGKNIGSSYYTEVGFGTPKGPSVFRCTIVDTPRVKFDYNYNQSNTPW
jgi:hypothetical protein